MDSLVGVIVILSFLLFMRFIMFNYKLSRIISLGVEYCNYVSTSGGNRFEIMKKLPELKKLFYEGGVEDINEIEAKHVGYGKILFFESSYFKNILILNVQIIRWVVGSFAEAEGVFRKKRKEAFNPIFWLEFFIYLPKNLMSFLQLNKYIKDFRLMLKISYLVYWALLLKGFLYYTSLIGYDFLKALSYLISKVTHFI